METKKRNNNHINTLVAARREMISRLLYINEMSVPQMMSRRKLSLKNIDDCITFLDSNHYFVNPQQRKEAVLKFKEEQKAKKLAKQAAKKQEAET